MKKFTTLLFSIYSLLLFPSILLAQPPVLDTIEKAMPSIVGVKAEGVNLEGASQPQMAIDPSSGRMVMVRRTRSAYFEKLGAGIVIDRSGIIVTNFHTISYANRITVKFYDGTERPAKIVELVPQHDFAFLRIQPPDSILAVAFADSDQVKLGDEIINVGHSTLLSKTISGGKVTGIGTSSEEKKENNTDIDMIQVNINIYKGDSGGPLLDKQGRLLGLMMAKNRTIDRASFAIPSNKIRDFYFKYLQKNP